MDLDAQARPAGGAALTSRMLDALRDQIRPRGGGRHVTLSFWWKPW